VFLFASYNIPIKDFGWGMWFCNLSWFLYLFCCLFRSLREAWFCFLSRFPISVERALRNFPSTFKQVVEARCKECAIDVNHHWWNLSVASEIKKKVW